MFNIRLTEVVKNLIIINVLFFIGSYLLEGMLPLGSRMSLALFPPTSEFFQPYQIVTHMFMHDGFMHILFNMLVLAFFGPHLESMMGPKRFLTFYFLAGFGAAALYLGVKYLSVDHVNQIGPMLGASGATVAVFTAYGLKFPNQRVMLLIPPIPMKAIQMVTILLGFDLVLGVLNLMGMVNTGIAHFAHIGGAIVAIILLQVWYKISDNFR